MKNTRTITGLSVLALAGLFALSGCANNSAIDDPDNSNSFLTIESIDPTQLDASLAAATTETADVKIQSLLRTLGSNLDDVAIETYTVLYEPPLPDAGGAITSLQYLTQLTVPAGGSQTLTATIIPATLKATLGAATNSVFTVTIVVSGQDLNLLPAAAEASFTMAVLP